MLYHHEPKRKRMLSPTSSEECVHFQDALHEHGVTATLYADGKLRLDKPPQGQTLPVPRFLLTGIDEHGADAGMHVLSQFFRYMALATDREAFERHDLGDVEAFRIWWRQALLWETDAVCAVVGAAFRPLLDAAAADNGLKQPREMEVERLVANLTPFGAQRMHRATVGLLLRSAPALESGAPEDLAEQVFLGRDGEHAVFSAKDGRKAYYLNLDRLEGEDRYVRMERALEVLAAFGSAPAREAISIRQLERAQTTPLHRTHYNHAR